MVALLILGGGCSREGGGHVPIAEKDAQGVVVMTELEAGQVWSYRTREGEAGSRVTICRVEESEALGEIVHVQVTDVAMASPSAPDGIARIVHHLPFSGEALRASLVELEGSARVPASYEEGYGIWREAFDAGEAGVFSISVAEAIGVMEETLGR
jgi:hypothetical protein